MKARLAVLEFQPSAVNSGQKLIASYIRLDASYISSPTYFAVSVEPRKNSSAGNGVMACLFGVVHTMHTNSGTRKTDFCVENTIFR